MGEENRSEEDVYMKKYMRKGLCLLLCLALLLPLTACNGDEGYFKGMRALRAGEYQQAYAYFRSSTDTRAPGILKKFAWVPVTYEKTDADANYHTVYTYDAAGFPVEMVYTVTPTQGAQRVHTKVYSYVDGIKRTEQKTSNSTYNDDVINAYDAQGNLTYSRTSDKDGNVVEETFNVYDGKGNPLVSDYTYISRFEGDVSELYDRSEYTYDHKGRVTSIVRNENVYAGTQSVTTFTYAEDGSYVEREKRVETSASLNILSYEKELHYDAEGRLVRQYYKYPQTEMLDEYTYDDKGNKVSSVHRVDGRTITGTYAYDEKNRLLEGKEVDAEGAIRLWEQYTYDEKGKPLTEKNSSDGILWNEVTYIYDESGLLTTKSTKHTKGRWETVTYQYNEDGTVKMEETIGSDGTTVIAYGYDEWGNMVSKLTQRSPAKGYRTEVSVAVTRTLYYYPDGVPEDITQWLKNIEEQ